MIVAAVILAIVILAVIFAAIASVTRNHELRILALEARPVPRKRRTRAEMTKE